MSDTDDAAANPLLDALRALPASGSGSFENLVRDLLSHVTGQRFVLAKSGPQGGVDSRSDGDDFATVIGVEAKRYGQATRLPLDETKSKLRDAATSHPDLELWILCASREIKEPDAGQLRDEGEALGIEVLLLDWPDSAELIPGLVLLAAANQDILAPYIAISSDIGDQLAAARGHPSFDAQFASLRQRLVAPSLGYANSRDGASEYIRRHMASMPAASARIGRYTNLADPSVIRVARPQLRDAISGWWGGQDLKPVLMLLGAEGLGKTWAALSWWLDRELAGAALPLTMIVPARFIADGTPDVVIGTTLHQMFGIRSAEWWARRARRWCANAENPRLLLIVDGLNERFDGANWSRLTGELRLEPWGQVVEIICTDRWDHWRRVVGSFQAAAIPYAEQTVGPFEDAELDEVLGRAGLERDKLDKRLIPLMKVPRLCALAIRHWEKLGQSGDITPERLVYEDFKDRIYPGLDDDEMRNLIAGIGREIMATGSIDATVLRRKIGEALAEESGTQPDDATISSIVSGIWFEPQAGEPHRFRVNPDLAPIAIGLAVARAVQSLSSADEVTRRIEAFVDDLRGLDLGVMVVGIAASFATIWPDCSPIARDSLLDHWLRSANFYSNELRRYTRLISENPALFIDRTETVWRDRQRLHDDRNIHLAGLVNAAEAYPTVLAAFVERATLWLSETYGWRDGVNETESPTEVAKAAVEARVQAWNLARGSLPPLIFKAPADDEDWVSVAGTTLSAISHLPREPFAAGLGNYAIGQVMMREVNRRDQFEWLLRANTEDPQAAELTFVAQARAIAAVPNEEAAKASDLLLTALSSLDPTARPTTSPERRWFGRSDTTKRSNDDVSWDYSPESRATGWGETALRYATDLGKYAPDPDIQLDPAAKELLSDAFADVLVNDADRSFDLWDELRIVLARWAPDLLAQYLSRTDSIDTGRHNFRRVTAGWKASWITHPQTVRNGIEAGFQASLRAHRETGAGPDPDLVVLALAESSPAAQFEAFLDMRAGPVWPTAHVDLLKRPTAAEFARLETVLVASAEASLLTGWLGFLSHADLDEMPRGYAPVAELMKHPEPKVRAAAMHVAWRADDKVLCNVLRDAGWTASAEGDEALHGSLALCCAEPIEGDDRPDRIIPLAIGFRTRAWPEEPRYAEAFARHVEGRVDRELNPPRSSQGFGYRIDDRASYRKLVEGDPEKVEQWVAPALNGVSLNVGIMLFSANQAIIEITRVLLALDRPSGATLWRALVKSMDESGAKSDGLRLMPFEAPANATTQALRLVGLASANLDEHLFDTASALRRGAESDWLVDAVRRMLASTVYDAARALVLAGELDCDEKADALWTEIRAYELPQWLSDVREHSHGRYVANVRAKDWLRAFIEAADPVEAFSAFELFRMTAGRTAGRWATSMMDEAKDLISTRKYDHWRLNVPSLNAAIKANAKAAKDHLAYTRVPRYEQAPWR